jgi:hypothetical protein
MISGNHFRHPIAQSAQYAVSIVIIGRMILPEPEIAQSGAPKSRERVACCPQYNRVRSVGRLLYGAGI